MLLLLAKECPSDLVACDGIPFSPALAKLRAEVECHLLALQGIWRTFCEDAPTDNDVISYSNVLHILFILLIPP